MTTSKQIARDITNDVFNKSFKTDKHSWKTQIADAIWMVAIWVPLFVYLAFQWK